MSNKNLEVAIAGVVKHARDNSAFSKADGKTQYKSIKN